MRVERNKGDPKAELPKVEQEVISIKRPVNQEEHRLLPLPHACFVRHGPEAKEPKLLLPNNCTTSCNCNCIGGVLLMPTFAPGFSSLVASRAPAVVCCRQQRRPGRVGLASKTPTAAVAVLSDVCVILRRAFIFAPFRRRMHNHFVYSRRGPLPEIRSDFACHFNGLWEILSRTSYAREGTNAFTGKRESEWNPIRHKIRRERQEHLGQRQRRW